MIIIILSSTSVGGWVYLYANSYIHDLITQLTTDTHHQLIDRLTLFNLLLSHNEKEMNQTIETQLKTSQKEINMSFTQDESTIIHLLQNLCNQYHFLQLSIVYLNGKMISSNQDMSMTSDMLPVIKSKIKSNDSSTQINPIQFNPTIGRFEKWMVYPDLEYKYAIICLVDIRNYIRYHYPAQFGEYLFVKLFQDGITSKHYIIDSDIYFCSDETCFSIYKNQAIESKIIMPLTYKSHCFYFVENGQDISLHKSDKTWPYPYQVITKIICDFSSLKQLKTNIFKSIFIILFVVILIAFVMATFFVNQAILKRIIILNQGVKRIATGDYSQNLDIIGQDELSDIAININDMQRKILKREEQLHDTSKKLEDLVDFHAQALIEANQNLIDELNERRRFEKALRESMDKMEEAKEVAEEANQNIMDSIRYAKMIQTSLMPNMEIVNIYLPDSFFIWLPRDVVGGDIFHTYPIEKSLIAQENGLLTIEDGIINVVIDCTGHGVPGAFMTMIASSALRRIIRDEGCLHPSEILYRLNIAIKKTLNQDSTHGTSDDGLDAAICYVKPEEKKLLFAGARLPLTIVHDQTVTVIKGDRHSIGYRKSELHYQYTCHEIDLQNGMSFYMYTDGYVDQIGGEKRFPFGHKRLHKLLQSIYLEPFDLQRDILIETFDKYQNDHPRLDDVTLVGFTFDYIFTE